MLNQIFEVKLLFRPWVTHESTSVSCFQGFATQNFIWKVNYELIFDRLFIYNVSGCSLSLIWVPFFTTEIYLAIVFINDVYGCSWSTKYYRMELTFINLKFIWDRTYQNENQWYTFKITISTLFPYGIWIPYPQIRIIHGDLLIH